MRVIFLSYIRADDVSFGYVFGKPVIKNFNLKLDRGEFTAVMGPNGSGKTTLGKLLVGILRPSSGKIFIEDTDNSKMSLGQIGSKIGYLFQNPDLQIFASTVLDELSFIMDLKDFDKDLIEHEVGKVLELLHLSDKKDSTTFNLSYGEKQRLALAGILMNKPDYLILDEPTTGLDALRKEILFKILIELLRNNIGITVITHDEKFIENFSGRIIKIQKGGIIETGIKQF